MGGGERGVGGAARIHWPWPVKYGAASRDHINMGGRGIITVGQAPSYSGRTGQEQTHRKGRSAGRLRWCMWWWGACPSGRL